MYLIKSKKLFNSKIITILLVTLVWLIADNLLEFVFPTYLDKINKSYFEIGLLLSLASVSGILIDLPMGNLSDRTSRKRLMIYGLVLSLIASILLFLVKGNFFLVALFLLWGIAYQVWKVPRDAHFASLTEKKHRAAFYGLDSEIKYIGQTLGPMIGGFILLYFNFLGILSFYSIAIILTILIILFFIKETNKRSVLKNISDSGRFSSIISELKELRTFGLFGIVLLYFSLLFTAWEQILWTFEPLFYGPNVLNIPASLGGLLLAFFSLPGIFLSYLFGKISDKLGKKIILFVGMLIMGISLLIFSFSNNLILIMAIALVISCGWVLSMVSLNSLIVDISYKHKKGKIVGIWNFFMDIGFVIGPLFGGLIADIFGIRNVFLIIGSVFLASSLFLILIKNNQNFM